MKRRILGRIGIEVGELGFGSLFGMIGMVLAAPLTSAAIHISKELAAARAAEGEGADSGRGPPRPDPTAPVTEFF